MERETKNTQAEKHIPPPLGRRRTECQAARGHYSHRLNTRGPYPEATRGRGPGSRRPRASREMRSWDQTGGLRLRLEEIYRPPSWDVLRKLVPRRVGTKEPHQEGENTRNGSHWAGDSPGKAGHGPRMPRLDLVLDRERWARRRHP